MPGWLLKRPLKRLRGSEFARLPDILYIGSYLKTDFRNSMMEKLIRYIKSFNWKLLLIFAAACVLLAVLNNLRVDDSKSVEWFGSQEILEKPEGF